MYKIGFIGGGVNSIAGYPHFIASQMDKRFEVTAGVFSTSTELSQQTGQKWSIPTTYKDPAELLTHTKNLDAIVVLLPSPLHSDLLGQLLAQNIPVICEKPLVTSLEELEDLERLYDKNSSFLVVTNNYSGYPMVRELQQRILNHELGDIFHIRLKMPQESFLRPPKSIKYPQKWRLTDGYIPMVSLDLGVHLHHLAYFLLQQEPSRLLASYRKFSKYGVVDDVDILLDYESGIKGHMWFGKTALGHRNGLHIEVYGSKASAVWHQETPEKLALSYTTGQKVIIDRGSELQMRANTLYNRMTPGHPAGFIESFANLYNDIADSLKNYKNSQAYETQYVYGFSHAANGIRLLHSASLSDEKKAWVMIGK